MAKKKTKTSKKKYPGGGKVHNFIQDPSEALYQNDINLAKAQHDAKSNPLVMGTKIAGQVGMQVGQSFGGIGGLKKKDGSPVFNEGTGNALNAGMGFLSSIPGFAMGGGVQGDVQGDVPIEIEKQEVVEDPNGNIMQANGPSHEQGGVDVQVPEGSMVYSDRIKVDNKSLAKHVATDTKKLDKAKKALESNPTDKINKETVARLEANLEKKKAKFQQLQDIFNKGDQSKQSGQSQPMGGQGMPMQGEQQFMNGGRAQYENGTGLEGVEKDPWKDPLPYYFGEIGTNLATGPGVVSGGNNEGNISVTGDNMGSNNMSTSDFNIPDPTPMPSMKQPLKNVDKEVKGFKEPTTNQNYTGLTGGDILGMAGSMYSGIAPMMNTMKNRADDTVNTNMYKDYGLKGLESLSEAEKNLKGTFAENDKALERNAQTSRAQMRSSARGVNQLRAGDIATQQGMNQGKNAAYMNLAQQQQALDLQRGQQLNQRDQMVMQGAATADIANRMDKDNYSTQLGADKANLGDMVQRMGRNLNQGVTRRQTIESLEKTMAWKNMSEEDKAVILEQMGFVNDYNTEEKIQNKGSYNKETESK